jgi:hypothetical protein
MIIVSFAVSACAATGAESPPADLRAWVHSVPEELDREERIERLIRLGDWTKDLSASYVVDKDCVLALAQLLESDDLYTVHLTAIALGHLGARAVAAVPSLERAAAKMDESDANNIAGATQPSATELYVALNRIDGRPIPGSGPAPTTRR